MSGSRFHFHHRPFGRPGHVGGVAALQHDAFDRLRIGAGAGRGGIGARRGQRRPRCRTARAARGRRADRSSLCDEGFQPRAPLGEGQVAQVLGAVHQQIVGAQMRGKLQQQLRRHGLAVQPLLQHVERLHAAVAHDQQLAVDRAGQPQRFGQIGKAFGDVLAGARIEPRRRCGRPRPRRSTACTRMPSHFHSAMKSRGIERGEVASPRSHAPASPGGTAPDRATPACRRGLPARRTVGVGRREAGPENLDLVRLLAAERGGGGLGEPRRHADAQAAGDELEQRPAPGLVERVEPARELRRKLRFAERRERLDHLGQRRDGVRALRRIGRPDQRDGLGEVADIVVGQPNSTGSVRSAISARITPALACWNDSAPVSAASAKPRSGSGVLRR